MKITTSLGVLPMRLPKGGLALAGFVLLMVVVLACKKEVEAVATPRHHHVSIYDWGHAGQRVA